MWGKDLDQCSDCKLACPIQSNSVVCLKGPVGVFQVSKNSRPAKCFTFGLNRGLFAGISVGGTVIKTRDHVNHKFYGIPVASESLLSGTAVQPPPAASVLYKALHAVFDGELTHYVEDDLNGNPVCSPEEYENYPTVGAQPQIDHDTLDLSESNGFGDPYNMTHSARGQSEGLVVVQEDAQNDRDGELLLAM